MAEQSEDRVGVYLDFDNIVISRYNQLHGPNQFAKDKARHHTSSHAKADPAVTARIQLAMIDIGAVLDYASSFGSIVISRAYADWSAAVNARYQRQLTDRAVDLIQLFPTVASLKNGADIRLAIDVMEDSFRLADLSHIVIVAGDSDYIPLAQRCKRLGRYVIGIGVSGATSTSLAAACHEFADYDSLPGIVSAAQLSDPAIESADAPETAPAVSDLAPPAAGAPADPAKMMSESTANSPAARKAATALLVRAMDLLANNDQEWQHASALKLQMRRMDPSFQERTLGFRQFSDFLKSRHTVVELDKKSPTGPVLLRLRA
ncbi:MULTISPECIES: NYN domain-containing protein [unclassified Cryobacterium]|uniref:NYN domain-containing protein n=1 Tax=unclassified Cryobacterium TaxID=2649013 RepID=UPI001069144A|nr:MULTISPECIES: NYN domain-containing protein [unclassified Cryobacterium]TFC50342.1 NYN domain-containing protein [Cryobacterium sp. TMB3-1-2]TFC71923.1 NYN domain-containing protein [Cryobacterium sp. TMB3-15]TFC78516.1 NYN domain-containing protein [Cryobacterium sp. TMB3-10]TFD44573.1 NYN domain-containing protein [Cryobacterium sp. TMB3-12]